ncbi:ABC transporter permease subunit [Lactococcus hircilactis]|uniref:ABC transporter permease subunit n=1 Tax=Lactococcus hircilactis TaxID=1494462 RepID=A0A7X1Z9A6_9LACT|nr:ABC transporter permease [Lactococcus hircilactis]MQW40113.1 ABC transporter permease subunit [Lactococcus hircilactis]
MSDKKQKNTMSLTHGIKREIRNDKLALYSSIILVILFVGVYVTAMFIKKTSYVDVNIMDQYLAPLTNGHLLGTDVGGRDIILMLIISARNSFNIAIAVTLFTLFVGNVLGVTTGYFGGKVDFIFMRFTDFVMILPNLMIIIVLVTIIPKFNAWSLIGIMCIFSWIGTTRLIRARTLTEVNRDYVRASKTSGTSNLKIMFREIWPNLSSIIIAESTLVLAGNIGLETGLSFLGFGLPAGTPSLGSMVSEATNPQTMTAMPWTWVPATVLIVIVILGTIFIGQALRRVADQRQSTN